MTNRFEYSKQKRQFTIVHIFVLIFGSVYALKHNENKITVNVIFNSISDMVTVQNEIIDWKKEILSENNIASSTADKKISILIIYHKFDELNELEFDEIITSSDIIILSSKKLLSTSSKYYNTMMPDYDSDVFMITLDSTHPSVSLRTEGKDLNLRPRSPVEPTNLIELLKLYFFHNFEQEVSTVYSISSIATTLSGDDSENITTPMTHYNKNLFTTASRYPRKLLDENMCIQSTWLIVGFGILTLSFGLLFIVLFRERIQIIKMAKHLKHAESIVHLRKQQRRFKSLSHLFQTGQSPIEKIFAYIKYLRVSRRSFKETNEILCQIELILASIDSQELWEPEVLEFHKSDDTDANLTEQWLKVQGYRIQSKTRSKNGNMREHSSSRGSSRNSLLLRSSSYSSFPNNNNSQVAVDVILNSIQNSNEELSSTLVEHGLSWDTCDIHSIFTDHGYPGLRIMAVQLLDHWAPTNDSFFNEDVHMDSPLSSLASVSETNMLRGSTTKGSFRKNRKAVIPLVYDNHHGNNNISTTSLLNIDPEKLNLFVETIEIGYSKAKNPYHNFIHAVDVLQAVCHFLTQGEIGTDLPPLETFSVCVAAIIHDFGHPGRTNQFFINANHTLALTYNNESILENFHAAEAFKAMDHYKCHLIDPVKNPSEYTDYRRLVIQCVLATDLSKHMNFLSQFTRMMKDSSTREVSVLAEDSKSRTLLLQMLIKCADLNHPARPTNIHKNWCSRILSEFFEQGMEEAQLGMEVSPFMDRDNFTLCKSQYGFISVLVRPIFSLMGAYLGQPMYIDYIDKNFNFWKNSKDNDPSMKAFMDSIVRIRKTRAKGNLEHEKHFMKKFSWSPLASTGVVLGNNMEVDANIFKPPSTLVSASSSSRGNTDTNSTTTSPIKNRSVSRRFTSVFEKFKPKSMRNLDSNLPLSPSSFSNSMKAALTDTIKDIDSSEETNDGNTTKKKSKGCSDGETKGKLSYTKLSLKTRTSDSSVGPSPRGGEEVAATVNGNAHQPQFSRDNSSLIVPIDGRDSEISTTRTPFSGNDVNDGN